MKRKLSMQIAVGLAVALTAALTTAPASATTGSVETGADSGIETNLLANGSFEELGTDGWPVAWSPVWASSAAAFSIDDTNASDGELSLRILDESPTRGVGMISDSVPVTAGASYEFSFDALLASGRLQPTVYWLDANGEKLEQSWESVNPELGVWSPRSVSVTAPEGAVTAQALIYSSGTGLSDGLIDNVNFALQPPQEVTGVEENLGDPIAGVTNSGAGFTENAAGRDIGLLVAGGSPSAFSAVDIVTGELLMTQVIEDSTQTWAYATTPDRKVYLGTSSGEIFVFDPDALTLTLIADGPFGQTYFWEAQASETGQVYFASYPDGKIISYDPATDQWHDFGVQMEGNSYARSMAVDGTDVYTGGGTTASLTRLDTTTGEITQIALPSEYTDQEFVYDVGVAGNTLFARPTPANDLLVYSLTEERWVDSIPSVVGLEVSPAVETSDSGVQRTEVLIAKMNDGMIAYDLETHEKRTVSINLGGAAARGWALQAVDIDGFPGMSLVTATSTGTFAIWNPETGQTKTVQSAASPTPFLIRSLGTGPDGDVWVGGYASPPGIARVDAETGETELLRGVGQVEGLTAHGDNLVIATYPGASVYSYDTTQPWDSGTNPAPRVQIGHEQDRPVTMTSAGDVVAIGTVPGYGRLGGSLTLFDPDTGDMEVFDNVIENQTIISLAYKDGLIYGGTGIWGGLGIDPVTTEGQLFIFDPATKEVTFQTIPAPGEENVSALAFDPEGNLWGITANDLFQFDPETLEVVRHQRYFEADDSNAYWTGRELFWHEGKLVGETAGKLFEIDPETLEMTIIQSAVQNLAIDRLGNYYYNRGGTLFRWVPVAKAPVCDEIITGDRRGRLDVSSGTTCLADATITGPVRIKDGASVEVVNSSIAGPFRADGAANVTVRGTEIAGPVTIKDSTGDVVLSGNTIVGPLTCRDNALKPTDDGAPNTVTGPTRGQCSDM